MASDESKPPEEATPPQETASTDAAEATLLAVSTQATAEDAENAVIYNCIVLAFTQQGLPTINEQTARIVWSTIDDSVITFLGNGVTSCITAKGFHVTPLAPVFATLKEMNQVTVVSDLVKGIAQLVTA